MLKTKSQMIMRIAQLSEENTLLREQLYNKSETEQALQCALEENKELKELNEKCKAVLTEIKDIAEPIYEQIPDDKVLRQILLKISEV